MLRWLALLVTLTLTIATACGGDGSPASGNEAGAGGRPAAGGSGRAGSTNRAGASGKAGAAGDAGAEPMGDAGAGGEPPLPNGGAASVPNPEAPIACAGAAPYAYAKRLNPVWHSSAHRIRRAGKLTFVGWEGILARGVSVLDLSGATPRELSFIPGSALFDVADGKLAMKNGARVELFDIGEDGSYELTGTWESGAKSTGSSETLQYAGNLLYVSVLEFQAPSGSIVVLDVTDAAKPKLLTTITTGHFGGDIALEGSLLASSGSDGKPIVLYDVSVPAQPKLLTTITDAGNSIESVLLREQRMFVSRGLQDIWVYDVTDPSAPKKIADIPPDTAYVRQLALRDDQLYILATGSVRVVDISDLEAPLELATFSSLGSVRDILVGDDRVLMADEGLFELGFAGCAAKVPPVECDVFDSVLVNPNATPGKKQGYTVMTLEQLKGVKCISGFLEIRFTDSLAPLSSLETVGELNVNNCASLTSLAGLEHLTHLRPALTTGSIIIKNNPKLTDLSALAGLRHIPSGLYISDNAALESLAGLGELWSIAEGVNSVYPISLTDNAVLSDVSALDTLRLFRGEDVSASGNPALNDCGLRKLALRFGVAGKWQGNANASCPP